MRNIMYYIVCIGAVRIYSVKYAIWNIFQLEGVNKLAMEWKK